MVKVKTLRVIHRTTHHMLYNTLPVGTEVMVKAKTNGGTYLVEHKNGIYAAQGADLEPFVEPWPSKPVPKTPHADDLGVLPPVKVQEKAADLLAAFRAQEGK